jgi:hypothetical protein
MLGNYVLVYDKNSLLSFMHVIHHLHVHALLLIMHHCIRAETETPELEEVEPEQESVADDNPFENQGSHLSILPYFGSIGVYMSCCVLGGIRKSG